MIRIATRRSELAMWQAQFVADALKAARPGLEVSVLPMSTRGDEILDRPLAAVGGKGLFTHALEQAMVDGRAELAVHSLKDVPAMLPPGMVLAAVMERADPHDAFISNRYESLEAMPPGARVGTSSLRRRTQLCHRFPALEFVDLRGNVNTRLARLDDGALDAIVLAVAGLQRLGLDGRIRSGIDAEICLPAIGQGALAIECRADDAVTRGLLEALEHTDTRCCVEAERAVNRVLEGSCHAPLAAFATLDGGTMTLRARVVSVDGATILEAVGNDLPSEAVALGEHVAAKLLEQGAGALLSDADPGRG
jgi:hydroxymethylbilane synthase